MTGWSRVENDERGASLVLAIVFMVLAAALGAAITQTVTSGINDTKLLSVARDREYSADSAIQSQIAKIRSLPSPGVTDPGCPVSYTGSNDVNAGIDVVLSCANTPTLAVNQATGTITTEHNVSFFACSPLVAQCSATTAIITALVNFQGSGASGSAYVEAWSVNG